MRIKSVNSPSQLIPCLTYSEHSVHISYYNYLLSHSFYILKLLSWVNPCLTYTLCLFMVSVLWPLSNNKHPNILSSPHGLVLFTCSHFSCLRLNFFLATLCFSLAYWASMFQTGWAIGVDHSCFVFYFWTVARLPSSKLLRLPAQCYAGMFELEEALLIV